MAATTDGPKQKKERDSHLDGRPSVEDIMQSTPVKAHASFFVEQNAELLDDDRKREIASVAFSAGVVLVLKVAERILGDFGASSIFSALCEPPGRGPGKIGNDDAPTSGGQGNSIEERPRTGDETARRRGQGDPMFA
jgi:hypothetical protein